MEWLIVLWFMCFIYVFLVYLWLWDDLALPLFVFVPFLALLHSSRCNYF